MQIDVPALAVGTPPQSSSAKRNILLEEKYFKLRNKQEKDAFKNLKTRRFMHTSAYDLALLHATGMDVEFDFIFRTDGWEGVWNVVEQGSKLLTLEFLCTLQITDTGGSI